MKNPATHIWRAVQTLMLAIVASCGLASCDSVVYDELDECSVTYILKFRYDMNMKYAQAFAHEVKSVHVYAYNVDNELVWEKTESGSRLADDDYSMVIDLPAGSYHFVAWCGLDNDDRDTPTFVVEQQHADRSSLSDLRCRLRSQRDADGNAFSDERLTDLYHGAIDATLPEAWDSRTYEYTMPLVKDTNHVRIILQQLSGEDVNVDDFTFRIDADNGLLDHDNSVIDNGNVAYLAYYTGSGVASLGIDDYTADGGVAVGAGTITKVNVAVADLSISRLMANRSTILTIESGGEVCARIPLTDYALILKEGYADKMGDQEYLDRQDEYSLTLFLDKGNKWVSTCVIINAWKLVLNDVEF